MQVLKDPPPTEVQFEQIENWTHAGNGIFTYTTSANYLASTWDWIGIYQVSPTSYLVQSNL